MKKLLILVAFVLMSFTRIELSTDCDIHDDVVRIKYSTNIMYHITCTIYDAETGYAVWLEDEGFKGPGDYTISIPKTKLKPGTYYYALSTIDGDDNKMNIINKIFVS